MPGATEVIAQMRHDHDDHGEQLRKLESITDNFTLPDGACRSWQALYAGSAKLANDLMEHFILRTTCCSRDTKTRRRHNGKPIERARGDLAAAIDRTTGDR